MPLPAALSLENAHSQPLAKEGFKILGASLFIAFCAQVAIQLPFSPVPITFHSFAIALTGWMLGPKRGALAVLAYLTEGAMGLPVFAHGGAGIAEFLGPKGGYLISFIPAVMVSGYITKGAANLSKLLLGFLLSSCLNYSLGLPWLSLFVGIDQSLNLGLYPFIVGDLLKTGIAASCVKIWEVKNR